MDLEQAINFAENKKAKWEKDRGSKISDFVWYVITFNDSYAIIDSTQMKRHPVIIKRVVYDTNVGIYKLD